MITEKDLNTLKDAVNRAEKLAKEYKDILNINFCTVSLEYNIALSSIEIKVNFSPECACENDSDFYFFIHEDYSIDKGFENLENNLKELKEAEKDVK